MSVTLAFDVYGTLIDPFGIAEKLRETAGELTPRAAQVWRDKQIEYLFRRGLMKRYEDFAVCTSQALDYTSQLLQLDLSATQKGVLLQQYRKLPPYDDVAVALRLLREMNVCLYAFSNGRPDDLRELLKHADINDCLDGIVSVHDVRSFKPDPRVYDHFLAVTGAPADQTWLVSANPFDIIGAAAGNWNTAWLRRDPAAVFDPWGIEATITIATIGELATSLPA